MQCWRNKMQRPGYFKEILIALSFFCGVLIIGNFVFSENTLVSMKPLTDIDVFSNIHCRNNIYHTLWNTRKYSMNYAFYQQKLTANFRTGNSISYSGLTDVTSEWDEIRATFVPFLIRHSRNEELEVIAIGKGAELIALATAMMNCKAIAVDSVLTRAKLMHFNIYNNNFEYLVRTLWNSIGGGPCRPHNFLSTRKLPSELNMAPVIQIDSLTPLLRGTKIILVIGKDVDIQTALTGSIQLFETFKVLAVKMETNITFSKAFTNQLHWIVKFMRRRKFLPFGSLFSSSELTYNHALESWPSTVVWRQE